MFFTRPLYVVKGCISNAFCFDEHKCDAQSDMLAPLLMQLLRLYAGMISMNFVLLPRSKQGQ